MFFLLIVLCSLAGNVAPSYAISKNFQGNIQFRNPLLNQSTHKNPFPENGDQKKVKSFLNYPDRQTPNIEGAASDDTWNYSQAYMAPGKNFMLETTLRIDESSPELYPIEQNLRGADYNNQENIGGYEAALVMKKSGTNEKYRAMFSSGWKEVLLWSSEGGILAVKSYPFEKDQTYSISFTKQNDRLVVAVNGVTQINYEDLVVPIDVDSYSVGTKDGKVSFGRMATRKLKPAPFYVPSTHQPNFSLRTWKDITWGFDGDEPIFALPNGEAFATELKLVPGYTAQMALEWYVQNWLDEPFRADVIQDIDVAEQGQKMVFTITSKDDNGRTDLTSKTKVTITYDEAKNAYVYDHESQLIVPTGASLHVGAPLDIADPVFLQSLPSGSTHGRQWPVTHQWGVYQNTDGNFYKQPLNHSDWYPGYGTQEYWDKGMHKMKSDGGTWAVVGDPVANPMIQINEAPGSSDYSALMCWYAYDLHFNWMPGDGTPLDLPEGTYTFKWSVTSLPGDEAVNRLNAASFATPGDLNLKWLLFTAGVGNVDRFDKTALRASPFGEFVWGDSSYQDTTVGKDDNTSLRLDGPDFVKTTAGDSQYTESFEPNTDYEISVWVKTEDVQGQGPGIVFSGHPYYPGITGTHDWQQIGFVARPDEPLNAVPFTLHLSGSGRAWFDNFQIRPISTKNPVNSALNNSDKPLSSIGNLNPDLLLNINSSGMTNDIANSVLDLSGHGNNAVAQKVVTASDYGHTFFHFNGNDSQILMRGHDGVNFATTTSMVFWVKPGEGQQGWNVPVSGGPAMYDRWRIVLNKIDTDYTLYAHIANTTIADPTITVPQDEWSQIVITDDGSIVSLYFNDVLVGTAPTDSSIFGKGAEAYVRLGAMSYAGQPYAGFDGDSSQLKIYNKALTLDNISLLYQDGPFSF